MSAGDTVNEAELRGLFANAAGFKQLKLIRGNKSTTCFVEFSDVPTAMACHAAQQVSSLSCLVTVLLTHLIHRQVNAASTMLKPTVAADHSHDCCVLLVSYMHLPVLWIDCHRYEALDSLWLF